MQWYEIRTRGQKLRALNFFIGGRGLGKTYSAIDLAIERATQSGAKILYLRNKKTQMDECATPFGNPFKAWARDHGRDIYMAAEKNHYMIYERVGEEVVLLGYGAALSTFENLRGVDLSDVDIVIYDEFIELGTLAFDQFKTFTNFYETVNRNRELFGRPPLMVFLLSNSQKLNNPILAGFGCIGIIERMIKDGRSTYLNPNMFIELIPETEVSDAKKNTVLYRATKGTSFYDEAIRNKFANDSFAGIGKKPINEYVPVCRIDDLFVYKHKRDGRVYISRSPSNRVPEFTMKDTGTPFMLQYGAWLKANLASGQMLFEDFQCKAQISDILK